MTWGLRWFFAIVLALGYLASTCTGLLGFLFTHNPSCLVFVSAPLALLPALRYLVPMDEFQYQLTLRKIAGKAHVQRRRGRARRSRRRPQG